MSTIEKLASYIHDVNYTNIPEEVIDLAEDCVLDAVGAAVTGFQLESTRAVREVVNQHWKNGQSTHWFTASTASTMAAGFTNSMAASAADIDDGHRMAAGHAGSAVVPAAIAIAEEVGASPQEILTAIVLGYETAVRLAIARNPEMNPSTASGRWCGFGVAAVGAKLRRLTVSQTIQALLITEQHSPGLLSAHLHGFGGSHVKEGIAWSVVTGIVALDLAMSGFKGYPNTLEQPRLYDGGAIIKDLGNEFLFQGTFFKPYACCRWIHPAIDAFRSIMEKENLSAKEINAVHVETFNRAYQLEHRVNPSTAEEAQFSLPFILGIVAVFGPDHLLPLDIELLANDAVVSFGSKVTMEVNDQLDACFPAQTMARVFVETAGNRLEALVKYPLGDPVNPMKRAGLQDKFSRLTSLELSPQAQKEILANTSSLRDDGFSKLIEILGRPLQNKRNLSGRNC